MRPRPQLCVSGRVNSPHFEHSVTRLKSFSRRGSELGAHPHLVGIAAGRPTFLDPLVGVLLGDDVHQLALPDFIGEQMATWSDPLGMTRRVQDLLRHIAGVQQ